MHKIAFLVGGVALLATVAAHGAGLRSTLTLATPTGPGAEVGSVTITQSAAGAVFTLNLHGLPPGPHGFHIHNNPSCAPAEKDGKPVPAGGAGSHLDPAMTAMHMGPIGEGHIGDLPLITVDAEGRSNEVLVAPRIKSLELVRGHALMIHAGGDNYADQPAPLGGGGARLACGVVTD